MYPTLVTKYNVDNHFQDDEMDMTCSIHGGDEKC
jgi:hypothetical protein